MTFSFWILWTLLDFKAFNLLGKKFVLFFLCNNKKKFFFFFFEVCFLFLRDFFGVFDLNLLWVLFGFNFQANAVTRERKIVKGLQLELVVLKESLERMMGWPLNNVEKGCVNLFLSSTFSKHRHFLSKLLTQYR